jgi:DNA-binding IclR family transcriptional regulator
MMVAYRSLALMQPGSYPVGASTMRRIFVPDSYFVDKLKSALGPIELDDASRKQVGAVVTAASVVEMLCAERVPFRMTTIARRLGIAPSSCFNILRTLTQEGVIRFDEKAKTYAIDFGLISIAREYLTPGGSLRVVGPLLEEFARSREVTLVIWRRAGHHMMVVTYFDNGSAVRIHIEPGARFPILSGAMGRIMAAKGGISQRELKQYFSRVKWETPIGFDEFMAEADRVGERGWAFDNGAFNSGIATLSIPLDDGNDPVDAVLSATMFVGQHDDETVETIATELREIAKLLASVKIGRTF